MCERRSTRVQTDRVFSVPGTEFQPAPQIASISASWAGAWHRFRTDFQSGRRLLASRRVLGQVPGTDFQPAPQIASISASWAGAWHRLPPAAASRADAWHRLPPGTDLAAPIWPPYRYARVGAPSYSGSAASDAWRASLAGAWHRFGRRIDTLGSEPQATVDPPRRMPGARPWQVPGTDLAAVSIRSGRSPKLQWIRRVGCLARVLGRCLAPISSIPGTDFQHYRYARVGAPSYASWAGAWHRLPARAADC
jgi:hypothetical protein